MAQELYEHSYRSERHFSFGQNWKEFLESFNERKLEEAMRSLTEFLGGKEALQGKTFVDVGCGSGLFSLAAFRLGAARVVSVDIDESSVWCAKHLRGLEGEPAEWEILTGSALDPDFIGNLGRFDIVYSWGVLHHTGDMWKAIENVIRLVASGGRFYIAIYNDNPHLLEGSSAFWVKAKYLYNRAPTLLKRGWEAVYTAYYKLGLRAHGIDPEKYINAYDSLRGMSFATDIRDWIGGYPYEYARTHEMRAFFWQRGFRCIKEVAARSIGCNEFLFTLEEPLPPSEQTVSVLIPVYNSEETLDHCLESVFGQTYTDLRVVCVDDASTDATAAKLRGWQSKVGSEKLMIIRNEENLGVTRSLNRGLAAIGTRYTARIDADDWWDTSKTQKQVEFLRKNQDHAIVGCNYENIHGAIRRRMRMPETDWNIKQQLIKRNPFAHSCVLFETRLIKEIGGYDERVRYGSDYDLFMRMAPYTRFHNLQEFLCFRTIREAGISIKKQKEQMLQGVRSKIKFIRRYRLPAWNYIYLSELLAVAYCPKIVRDLKRKFLR